MKLRALHLSNVRRFTGQKASITGIGDGLSVVSEANEFGKSTFFDAIHTLFFEKYSATAKAVKSLQPYARGAVEIAAEVETGDGLFRIEKRFLSRPMARVTRLPDGTTLAQDDEAERWISGLMGPDHAGPAGLLWVRQGLIGLEPDSPKEKTQLTETRRNLLSSVAGEIDAMTGGRRMDRVMERVGETLGEIATKTGKERGPWKAAVDEVARLEGLVAEVEAQVAVLSTSLDKRKEVEATLQRLELPEARERRATARAQAQKALADAQAHDASVASARQARDLAAVQSTAAMEELDRFLAAADTLEVSRKEARDLEAGVARMREVAEGAKQRRDSDQAAHKTAVRELLGIRKSLDQARMHGDALKARDAAVRLASRIETAEAETAKLDVAQAQVAASKATAEWVRRVEGLDDALRTARAAAEAQRTTIRLEYDGDARVSVDGEKIGGGVAVPVDGAAHVDLPGIGRMVLQTGSGSRADRTGLDRMAADRDAALAEAGAETLAQAREMHAARQAAEARATRARDLLATLAPDGIDALRAEKARADLAAQDAEETPPVALDDLQAALMEAEEREGHARDAAGQADADHGVAREDVAKAVASAEMAVRNVERAGAACGPEDQRDERRAGLLRADARMKADLEAAEVAVAALTADAPDIRTAEAEFRRADAAVQSAEQQRAQLSETRAGLSSEIRTLAGSGIEERRDNLTGQLAAAREVAGRFARRFAALTRLQSALEAERTAARETYFGPVQQELKPLLAIIHNGADLEFDSDSLLPATMTRDRTEEDLDSLSGGTKEQIAILTRLAFARLFARNGHHIPIILDDALVFSDDDRIIRMFTALTRVADDQQILVFSCRQLAFQDLGGARPAVAVSDL